MADAFTEPPGGPGRSAATSKSRVRRILVLCLRTGVVILLMIAWFQRSLIYHPARDSNLAARQFSLPETAIDVETSASDNLRLHGWLTVAANDPEQQPPDPVEALKSERPLVILFPGNAGHRANRVNLLNVMRQLGADAMIFDHRGYGDNDGSPTEAQMARDARAIWKFATEELQVPARRIVLYGESLGGGVATRLAGDLGLEGIEPGALILQSTFNSLVDAGRYHFPWLPVRLILIDRFESEKHVANVRSPLLLIHGEQDEIVPLPLGQKLFDAAPPQSAGGIAKQQLLLPNANHNDVYFEDGPLVLQALKECLTGVQTRATRP